MITNSAEGPNHKKDSGDFSQQVELLGSPTAENAGKALRLALLTSHHVDQRTVDFIKRALLIDKEGVQDRLRTELLVTRNVLFDRVGATLLHVDTELFSKDVIQLLAHGKCLDPFLVSSALSANIGKEGVVRVVLEVLHDREVQKLNESHLTKSYELLLRLLTQVLDSERVRASLLTLAALRHRPVSEGALTVLSAAIKYPEVADYFAQLLGSGRRANSSLDLVGLLLEAPSLSSVIAILATQISNVPYREKILARVEAFPHVHEVQEMLIKIVTAATWIFDGLRISDVFSYSFPDSMRRRAIEIIDHELGGPEGAIFASVIVEPLLDPTSTVLSFLRERMNRRSIQQALVKGLSAGTELKRLWCARLLKEVCDQPEVRGQLLPAALDYPAGERNLALEVLCGDHYSEVREPGDRIGARRAVQIPSARSGDYRWEG
jgi:hypothetical protein